MPKIQRKTQKIFCNSADSDQLAVFGSMSTGTPVYSSDIEELQSNEAFDLGWDAATLEDKAPFMEEMNGVQYGLTYQIAYGLQEGIPEYDAATTYYIGSICKVLEDGKPVLYTSLTDNNIGNNPVNDSTNWERLSFGGGGLEIGDIGIAPLGIDETKGKRRYLNGQLIIQEQYVQFTNKVKSAVALYPSLACTEEEWQATALLTVGGQVGKFVVDDEAGTIRLPKIIMPIQGLTDLSKLGEIVEAGLPNITGSITGTYQFGNNDNTPTVDGALYTSNSNRRGTSMESGYSYNVYFDASRSNPIYGNSNTVQQEQIQYPYFIQVATGAEVEDNIINEIELNNPFFYGMSQYFESEPNNISWLKSAGQWNAKAVYTDYYDWLLKIYNGTETVEGVSIKLSTEEYTDYDFVLNTADETFRLPLLDGSESLPSDRYEDLTLEASGTEYTAPANGWYYLAKTSTASGQYVDFRYPSHTDSLQSASLNTLRVKSEIKKGEQVVLYYTVEGSTEDFRFVYAQGNGSLYYYVGETVQNANLINAGRIEEKLADKLDRGNKEEIVGWGMPNYTSGVGISLVYGSNYVVPVNGWIKGNFYTHLANTGNSVVVNGQVVQSGYCTSGNQGSVKYNSFLIPVNRDDLVTVYSNNTHVSDVVFFPCKGVN